MADNNHLTLNQVGQVLRIVEHCDALLVGGQSLNIWARYYGLDGPDYPYGEEFTSKDVDFFRSNNAATVLADALIDGRLLRPDLGDSTAQNAMVIGVLDGREVKVDFLDNIIGVDD